MIANDVYEFWKFAVHMRCWRVYKFTFVCIFTLYLLDVHCFWNLIQLLCMIIQIVLNLLNL